MLGFRRGLRDLYVKCLYWLGAGMGGEESSDDIDATFRDLRKFGIITGIVIVCSICLPALLWLGQGRLLLEQGHHYYFSPPFCVEEVSLDISLEKKLDGTPEFWVGVPCSPVSNDN